jgi:DNA sulfur modification protein DndD
MLLLELKLRNFRQFYSDATAIKFSTDPEKNITLIHGENGVGKTTILNAIIWCLYNRFTPDFELQEELICLQHMKEEGKSCRVELHFKYLDTEYLAQRTWNNANQTKFKLFEIMDSNYKEMMNSKSFINTVLPDDMADYFFFQGEGISYVNKNKPGEKFKIAIRDILGFSLAESAILDLKDIHKRWSKELTELKNSNKEQQKLTLKKQEHEEKIDILKKRLKRHCLEKENVENDLENILDSIRTSSNSDAKELQREIDGLDKRDKQVSNRIKGAQLERQGLIRKFGFSVFGQKLAREGLDFIDEKSKESKIPAPYDEILVQRLVKAEECICGRELKLGTKEYSAIIDLLNTANNNDIKNRVNKSIAAANSIKNKFPDFLSGLEKQEKLLLELGAEKREIEISLKEKVNTLSAIDVDEVRKLDNQKVNCKKLNDGVNQKIGFIKHQITNLERDLLGINSELKRFGAKDIRLEKLTSYQEYTNSLIKLCYEKLDGYEKESRLTIASKVNSTVEKFSRSEFTVTVGEDFSFNLIRSDGKPSAKSRGENLLLNLSFVSALIDFANMRKGASGDFLVSGTTAPFVIDAPFGELDNTYKKATVSFLPERSRQLILLLSSSHWMGTVDETIRDKVGSEYLLVQSNTTVQKDKPEDRIMLDGKEYVQSLYAQGKDATFIEKIR